MITHIDRYYGIRPKIIVYGDGGITETEAAVLKAFLEKYQKDVTTGAPTTVYTEAVGDLLLGSDVRAPFHLRRQEPGCIARFRGERAAVVLESGYIDPSIAEKYLDGIVDILSRSNSSPETRDSSGRE